MVCKYMKHEIYITHRQKTVRLYLAVCSINCETLRYLHNIGKLTFGLRHPAASTKQR